MGACAPDPHRRPLDMTRGQDSIEGSSFYQARTQCQVLSPRVVPMVLAMSLCNEDSHALVQIKKPHSGHDY